VADEAATPIPATGRRIPGRKLLLAMLGILVVAVIPAVLIPLACRPPDPELPELGTVPKFSLLDDSGRVFTEEALRGHPTVVDFIFTRCDAICPKVSARMQRFQEHTGDRKGSAIKLLSISVDPEYDTPPRLAEYAGRYHADLTRWRFLTGPKAAIRSFIENPFANSMDPTGKSPAGAPTFAHNGYFVLVDANLVIRGFYDSDDEQRLDELVHHARYLARISGERAYNFGGS
jgi:protein SCO1/2